MVLDYDGGTLSYGTIEEAEAAWHLFQERYGDRVKKNLRIPMGYEDYKAYSVEDGFIIEVIFLNQPIQDVKTGWSIR